jgi:hypothetical protein
VMQFGFVRDVPAGSSICFSFNVTNPATPRKASDVKLRGSGLAFDEGLQVCRRSRRTSQSLFSTQN